MFCVQALASHRFCGRIVPDHAPDLAVFHICTHAPPSIPFFQAIYDFFPGSAGVPAKNRKAKGGLHGYICIFAARDMQAFWGIFGVVFILLLICKTKVPIRPPSHIIS